MSPVILLAGASGYVGGHLLGSLEAAGYRVRCMARKPAYLLPKVGAGTEVVQGDVLDAETLAPAMVGVETAYYLVHSMGSTGSFIEEDRTGARNFGEAAKAAGVKRIIYLGGLGDGHEQLSPHLKSRHETGEVLRESGVPVIEFRASIVIGSGSLSFEMIRSLVEKLPIMTTPRWVYVKAQPIAVRDLLDYLVAAISLESTESETFEIGGSDVVSYGELMQEYAKQRGLTRWIIPVPILSPYVSALWLGLITPLFARIGRKLVDSLRHPTIVTDNRARERFGFAPCDAAQAIAQALAAEERDLQGVRWCDSLGSSGPVRVWTAVRFGRRLMDHRTRDVAVTPAQAFDPVQRIGGERGWYYANFLWRIRGAIDLLVGGVGVRRGRRDPVELREGDVVDWWRVERLEPGAVLRLEAEMRMPGRAWLQFEVEPIEGGCRIHQTALYDPVGLAGRLYWYSIFPLHALVFRGMLRGIGRAAMSVGAAQEAEGSVVSSTA